MEEAKRCPHCMAENAPEAAVCAHCGAEMNAQNAPHQLPVGTVLAGRYRVGCCIGEGGFGITYAGWDETLDMKVAVKEYYPAGSVNRYNTQSLSVEATGAENSAFFERGRKRFLDEARTLAKFAYSANIVGVRDCFFENNTAYIVMEFLEGESLSQYLRTHGPMPFAQALALLDPVMAALEGIHAKGLIHRDISPSNLMLLEGGGVKLLDFGTARDASPAGERSLSVVLKPGYAPEEQYTTRGAQGPWSDVYAMSATLYRMITGEVPENALNRMPTDPLPAPTALGADIPPAQERALLHGMAVHASSRIRSMAELRAALRDGEAAPETAPEDDERTLYCVPADTNAAADIPAQTERMPDERGARMQRTPAVQAERETAHVPERTAKTAVQETPETADTPPKGAKRGERPPREKKTGKKKKKTGWIVLAAILCALAVGALMLYNDLREPSQEELSKRYQDQTITASMMRALARDRKKVYVSFWDCSFENGALEALAKSKTIYSVSFRNCSGIETLAPLAEMTKLEALQYSADSWLDEYPDLDGGTLFPVKMNCQSITLNYWNFKTGLAFLKNFQDSTSVSIVSCSGLDVLPEMPQLKYFQTTGSDLSACDLSVLPQCTQLNSVWMNGCGLESIDFLSGCEKLEKAELDDNAITSLRPLSGCLKLQTLSADSNRLTSLEGLEGKTLLSSLKANDNSVSDLTPLEQDISLGTLELGNNEISDLTPLSAMTELTCLNLYNNSVSDLRPLAGNERMQYMYLSYNQLTDLDGCENMIDLMVLRAAHNQIENLDGLINATQLSTVVLSDNKVSDISVLGKSAGKLNAVMIDGNDIADISALAGNPDMELVMMENNRISDLSALTDMSKLKYLSAYGNEISDITPLGSCKALYYVDLGENRIADISPLVASVVDKRMLLLQHNCFADISTLYRDTEYIGLSLYGNPIEDYSILRELTGISGFSAMNYPLIVTWTEKLNMEDIGASPYASEVRIVGVPKDRQANATNAFQTAKKASGQSFDYMKPQYVTEEEADAYIAEIRQQFRTDQKIDNL